jgi:hypothetical protein
MPRSWCLLARNGAGFIKSARMGCLLKWEGKMMKKIVIVLLAAVGAAALLTTCGNMPYSEGGEFDLMGRQLRQSSNTDTQIGEITGTITLTDVPSQVPEVRIFVSNGDFGPNGWSVSGQINLPESGTLSDISWSIPIYDSNGFFPANGEFSLSVQPAGSDNDFGINIQLLPYISSANANVGSLGTFSVKSVTLSGTITVTVDGRPVPDINIWAYGEEGFCDIDLVSPANGASWSMPFVAINSTVNFGIIGSIGNPYKFFFIKHFEIPEVTVSGANVSGIVLDVGDISFLNPVNPTPLTANTWKDGEINNRLDVDWYSINVTLGTTYYLWWNDFFEGDKTKTGDIDVYAFHNGTNLISFTPDKHYRAWDTPVSFTAVSTGTVYIRVRAWNMISFTGTYGFVYSTTNSRP